MAKVRRTLEEESRIQMHFRGDSFAQIALAWIKIKTYSTLVAETENLIRLFTASGLALVCCSHHMHRSQTDQYSIG